jgi:modulator of FtsH protease
VAYEIGEWSEFAVAHVGGSAALLGLVFVGLTINLRDVISSSQLVNRALEAVILLGGVLATSTTVLIPGQAREALSAELIVGGGALFAAIYFLQRGATTQPFDPGKGGPPRGSLAFRRVVGLGAPALFVVAGLTLGATAGGGLYWWPAAVLVSYLGALVNAWILLVEILR